MILFHLIEQIYNTLQSVQYLGYTVADLHRFLIQIHLLLVTSITK